MEFCLVLWYNTPMNIFKNYTYSWWQIGLFKLALLSLGVTIGAYWNEVFSGYIVVLLVIGVVFGVYLIFISLGQR